MTSRLNHEAAYRGQDPLCKLAKTRITVCGVGALGSNLVDSLTRMGGTSIRVIDKDKVEESNLCTQVYRTGDIGAFKTHALRNYVFGATGVELEVEARELDAKNVKKLLRGSELVVDCFDNSQARRIVTEHCRDQKIRLLHAGLSGDGYGAVQWDEFEDFRYKIPEDQPDDPCDLPLSRTLTVLVAIVAVEAVLVYAGGQLEHKGWTVTLGDLQIQPMR